MMVVVPILRQIRVGARVRETMGDPNSTVYEVVGLGCNPIPYAVLAVSDCPVRGLRCAYQHLWGGCIRWCSEVQGHDSAIADWAAPTLWPNDTLEDRLQIRGRRRIHTISDSLACSAEDTGLIPCGLWPCVESFLHYRFLRTLCRGSTRHAALRVPANWNPTTISHGYGDHQRTTFVHHVLMMTWISSQRIESWYSSFDFNNEIHMDAYAIGGCFFDLHRCRYVVLKARSERQGCFGAAVTADGGTVFHISLVTPSTARAIIHRITFLQCFIRHRKSFLHIVERRRDRRGSERFPDLFDPEFSGIIHRGRHGNLRTASQKRRRLL